VDADCDFYSCKESFDWLAAKRSAVKNALNG
jgi:hypothetical protein